jgi:hypothetical protein
MATTASHQANSRRRLLSGNAVHLKRAVARIAEANKAEPKHPASGGSRRSTSAAVRSRRRDRPGRSAESNDQHRGPTPRRGPDAVTESAKHAKMLQAPANEGLNGWARPGVVREYGLRKRDCPGCDGLCLLNASGDLPLWARRFVHAISSHQMCSAPCRKAEIEK